MVVGDAAGADSCEVGDVVGAALAAGKQVMDLETVAPIAARPAAVPVTQQDGTHDLGRQRLPARPHTHRRAVVDQYRFDLRLCAERFDHLVGQRHSGYFRGAVFGNLDDQQGLDPQRGWLRVFETFGQLDERVGTAMLPRVPRLTFRGTHAVDHPVDRVLETRTVEVR